MAEPFLSEIRIMSFVFAPRGWALCNGQLLPINQNQALFSLFGTTYGGNGQTTFALPDLRGRVPLHFGAGFVLGQRGGEEAQGLAAAGVPTPATLHVCEGLFAIPRVMTALLDEAEVVIKPASGSGGEGIVVLGARLARGSAGRHRQPTG